jgi:hypothetical protein
VSVASQQHTETPDDSPTVEVPRFYVVEQNKTRIAIEENNLAINLTNYLVSNWVNELLSNHSHYYRKFAAMKLAEWGSGSYILSVLKYVTENDEDPQVRQTAHSSLKNLKANVS